MVAWLLYLGVTVTAGFVLAFVVGLVKSFRGQTDINPLGILFLSLLLTIGGPFLYVEVLTKAYGAEMTSAVKSAFDDSPLQGKMQYYRVKSYGHDQAKALVIGEERTIWGGLDRPVMEVSLAKKSGKWEATSYRILACDRLNRDGLVFPPYH